MSDTLEKLAHTVNQAQTLEELSRPILELLHRITHLESTYLTTIDTKADQQHIQFARNVGKLDIPEGLDVPWSDTLCKRALEEKQFLTLDVPSQWGDSQAARALGLQTYLSTPVYTDDGALYGTLCGASCNSIDVAPDVQGVMQLFAKLIAQQIERERRIKAAEARVDAAEARAADMQLIATIGSHCLQYEELEPLLQVVAGYMRKRSGWDQAVPFVIHDHQLRLLQDQDEHIEAVVGALIEYRDASRTDNAEDARAARKALADSLTNAGWSQESTLEMISADAAGTLQGGVVLRAGPGTRRPPAERSLILSCSNDLTLFAERVRDRQLLEAANAQLTQHALHDPLTALPNRRYLVEEMARLLSRVKRTGETVYVAYIDLDGFKKINDTHGHETGDYFLQAMAAALSGASRSGDIISRLGGDEFVLVGAGTNPISGDEETVIADRISKAMSGEIRLPGVVIDYSGPSVGVVSWQGSEAGSPDADKLLKQADQAMYVAKLARRIQRG